MTNHVREQYEGWLRLAFTPAITIETALVLLRQIGLPQEIFDASWGTLSKYAGEAVAQALTGSPPTSVISQIERSLSWLESTQEATLLTMIDPLFPVKLLKTGAPPLLLFARGDLSLLARPAVAIVGSRQADKEGILNARAFGESLAKVGVAVVSGLTDGVETQATEGVLQARDDKTNSANLIAIMSTGLDRVYPAVNKDLLMSVVDRRGLLLSSFSPGTGVSESTLAQRAYLMAGLSDAVLVVQAGARSKALTVARYAGEMGREVFAIPGSIHSPLSKGVHKLIKQGAKLVERRQDILEELHV